MTSRPLSRWSLPALLTCLLAGSGALATAPVQAAPEDSEPSYETLDQSEMSIVDVSSEETVGEGDNGDAERVLDGDEATYWHTAWSEGVDPLPHHLSVDLGDEPQEVAQVRLLPRQSSTGSGRVHEYELHASSEANCEEDSFETIATGEFGGEIDESADERSITLDEPVAADCLKIVYLSSWGGQSEDPDVSPSEEVASLAEFNVDILGEDDGDDDGGDDDQEAPETDVVVPDEAVTVTDGSLQVRLHPDFPQVVDYQLYDQQMAGRLGEPLTTMLINEEEVDVEVASPEVSEDGTAASYGLTFEELPGTSMVAEFTVEDEALTMRLTDIEDPEGEIRRIRIPEHDLVSVTTDDETSQLTAADMSVDRAVSGDSFEPLAETSAGDVAGSWMVMASDSGLAAAFENNATEDNTAGGTTADRVQQGNTRWERQVRGTSEVRVGSVWSGTWTVRGSTAEEGIGADEDPFVTVKIAGDLNDDGVVDWQDAGVAMRDIRTPINGEENVPDTVVSRIPFNIVSQATHPFLNTLDETKRVALATEGLGQQVMLKGYQAEGHDSAHPDYAGNYNERAGGFEDLTTLVEEGEDYNARFGVHVNATESYSESRNFSEELLQWPLQPGWSWMNQSYRIDGPRDLGTGNVLDRFQEFRDEVPENLDWLYIDVYYPYGWEAQRLGSELADQGWILTTEWSDRFPDQSIWSHWANDENYGGQSNKGINSDVVRFVENDRRDSFNPHPILSNTNAIEYEGWTGHNDFGPFIDNIWERNLPTKFLQQSSIMTWEEDTITFENGTVATSPLSEIDGETIPTDREMDFDGARVYTQGQYLLPWEDDDGHRLYHYNPEGGSTTWELTDSYAGQSALTMHRLTDTGRTDEVTVPVQDGQVTLEAEAGTAYVLHPEGEVPEAVTPEWGEGARVVDPGFFSGGLEHWGSNGEVSVTANERGNQEAVLSGPDEAGLFQHLGRPGRFSGPELEPGTYSMWAWVEVEPGETREVSLEARGQGVTAVGSTDSAQNRATSTITSSTAVNATASDQKLGTYFQRLRVTFETTGGMVQLRLDAGEGDAEVKVDDVRIVPIEVPEDPEPTEETVLFEDFESVDTGYWPFVTGSSNAGGDARTQLAERNEPYSQSGWWGRDSSGDVVEGGKLTDNVISRDWSLMAHEENQGLILRTTQASVPLEPGMRYRVSFDYQSGDDAYSLVTGRDVFTDGGVDEQETDRVGIDQAHETSRFSHEFGVDQCGAPAWFGIVKSGGGFQSNLTVDDLRVEVLGEDEENPGCGSAGIEIPESLVATEPATVETTVTSNEQDAVTDVTHELTAEDDWDVELVDAGAEALEPGETSTATWTVTAPEGAEEGELDLQATYTRDGETVSHTANERVLVLGPGEQWLSDLGDQIVGDLVNGWGPIEFDMSNGEQEAEDGDPMHIDGVFYPKGLGVHAESQVVFDLDGQCTRFRSDVGVDDSRGDQGSVTFEVLGDGEQLAGPTDVLTGADAAESLDVDIDGVEQLELVVGDGGDGVGSDHANWAGARVTCS